MEETKKLVESKYAGQIQPDTYSGKSLVSKIFSVVILVAAIIAIFIFYKAFTPSEYDASLYSYSVDLSTMRDISLNEEECTKFTEMMNLLPSGDSTINSELYSYVDGWNGYKKEIITINDSGICNKEKTVKVGFNSEKSMEYDILYENEYQLRGLNRLYSSASGYVGIFNFIEENSTLGNLDMVAYVYADANMKKLAEVLVGKSKSTGMAIYKKSNTYDIDELLNRQ